MRGSPVQLPFQALTDGKSPGVPLWIRIELLFANLCAGDWN